MPGVTVSLFLGQLY